MSLNKGINSGRQTDAINKSCGRRFQTKIKEIMVDRERLG